MNNFSEKISYPEKTYNEDEFVEQFIKSWPDYKGKLNLPRNKRQPNIIFKQSYNNQYRVALNQQQQIIAKVGWGFYDDFIVDIGFFVVGGKHCLDWFQEKTIGDWVYLNNFVLRC